jgi:hypothetical protein
MVSARNEGRGWRDARKKEDVEAGMAHAGGCTDYGVLGDCDPGVLAVIAS